MQVSDLGAEIVVCSDKIASQLCQKVNGVTVFREWPGLSFVDASGEIDAIAAMSAELSIQLSPRFMDRFYVCAGCNADDRQELLDRFFNVIAPVYSQLVDAWRNAENVGILLNAINRLIEPGKDRLIVDFGCGVGLPHEAADATVVGVDPCPNMRALAENGGMSVWGPAELAQQPANSVDAAFASYVFHLLPSLGLFELLWNRMRTGGVFVANFHKGQGIHSFEDVVARLGGRAVDFKWPNDACHGEYRAVAKG